MSDAKKIQLYNTIRAQELEKIRCCGEAASVIMATLFKCDIAQAQGAAQNAVENNAAGLIIRGIAGTMALWTACDIYDIYKTEGAEAALIKTGVEVVVTIAGVKAFKVAGRLYPSAELAWGAYVAENPRLAAVAEYCAEQGSKGKDFCLDKGAKVADYIGKSGAAKFMSSVNAKVEAKFAQWFGGAETSAATGEYERFWTKSVDFKGNKVFQRDDLFDPKFVDDKGRTNLQRMLSGRAPIGIDGQSIELHHMLQTHDGPIAELTSTFHQMYKSIIHINPSSIPSGISRSKFAVWRENYWKNRVKDFTRGEP